MYSTSCENERLWWFPRALSAGFVSLQLLNPNDARLLLGRIPVAFASLSLQSLKLECVQFSPAKKADKAAFNQRATSSYSNRQLVVLHHDRMAPDAMQSEAIIHNDIFSLY
jgi:hypothetical protein